jgi:hypothetical protein
MFHTLIEKLNPDPVYYNIIAPRLFKYFVRICKFLPCPTCAEDAGRFLANISYDNCNTKLSFKNTFYLFHNYVNKKKKKLLFNYENINTYKNYRLKDVINRFLIVYNTKGNMQMLTQSFHRELLIKEFKEWLRFSLKGFLLYNPNNIIPKTIEPEPEPEPKEDEPEPKEDEPEPKEDEPEPKKEQIASQTSN